MTSRSSLFPILWLQVWALAAVQGSITLAWIIYNFYVPQFLQQLGFAAGLATLLVIVENCLGIVVEPATGGMSDRTRYWMGSRFPFIAVGVLLAAALFVGIPQVLGTGLATLNDWTRWILPVIAVGWAFAMSVFRSPAIALLAQYASPESLPKANAVLTLIAGLAGGFSPIIRSLILKFGPTAAFLIGSIVLLGSALCLRLLDRQVPQPMPASASQVGEPGRQRITTRSPYWPIFAVFGVGLGVGVAFRMMLMTFPSALSESLPGSSADIVVAGILLIAGVVALPAGWWGTRVGNPVTMLTGLVIMACCLALMLSLRGLLGVGLAAMMGIGFGLISNSVIPFALSMPAQYAGLGVGMYFGGFSAAMAAVNAVLLQTRITAPLTLVAGLVAILLASLCVLFGARSQAVSPAAEIIS